MILMRDAESEAARQTLLNDLEGAYQSAGYRFLVAPPSSALPVFFGAYRPDAIAEKNGEHIAIEVKDRATANQPSLIELQQLFEGHSEWRLQVVVAREQAGQLIGLPQAEPATILERLSEVRELDAGGHAAAAFILAWSMLEATARAVTDEMKRRLFSPGTAIQALAMNGLITPEEEGKLRELLPLRNRVVHGDITTEPTDGDIESILGIIAGVLVANSPQPSGSAK